MTEELQFVTCEQSRSLRKAGFDCECDYYYNADRELIYCGGKTNACHEVDEHPERCAAPSVALALQWIRHKLRVYAFVGRWFTPEIHSYGSVVAVSEDVKGDYFSEEAAEKALLDRCIELLSEAKAWKKLVS